MQEDTATSPRSTILDMLSPQEKSRSETMTSPGSTEVAKSRKDLATSNTTGSPADTVNSGATPNPEEHVSAQQHGSVTVQDHHKLDHRGTVSPSHPNTVNQGYPQSTPQQTYQVGYQSQVTPEPASPAGPTTYGTGGSFFQQPSGFQIPPATQYGTNHHVAQEHPPGSPSPLNAGGLPPPSPLFPRITGQAASGLLDQPSHTQGSAPPYLTSQHLGPNPGVTVYPNMHMYPSQTGSDTNSVVGDDYSKNWADSRNQTGYVQNSPQISAQVIPIPYVAGGMPPRANRSYSFEENMLPPPAVPGHSQHGQSQTVPQAPHQDFSNSSYSQYASSGHLVGNPSAGVFFNHQSSWGYGGAQPDMYSTNAGQLQARHTQMGYPSGVPRHLSQPMGAYGGQFFPSTSPGPPIQTTSSNKGPDGANLFIFHIPNHFSNLDMYQLFSPFGSLLSVRIMVEKDTGRSRGFGFVSYDSPDAAALAIKELNGFAIGNKRLKVQHKQIRSSDQHHVGHHGDDSSAFDFESGPTHERSMSHNLPQSGPSTSSSGWYHGHSVEDEVSQQIGHQGTSSNSQQEGGGIDTSTGQSSTPPVSAAASTQTLDLKPLRETLPDVSAP